MSAGATIRERLPNAPLTEPAPPEAVGPGRLSRVVAWTNLVVAAVAMLATFPSRTQGLGWITEPLLAEFALGRLAYSDLNFWATIGTAFFCVPCGWFVDRFGTRACLLTVVPLLSAATLWMGSLGPASGVGWLFVALLLCRMLGQGLLALVSTTLVGKSFPRRVGVVMGVYSVLIGLGYSGATQAVGLALTRWGLDWHAVWMGAGWLILIVLMPLGLWLVREPGASSAGAARERQSGVTFGAALRSGVFWMCLLSTLLVGTVNSGMALFYESILKDLGFEKKVFFEVLAFGLLMGAGFKLLGGWLAAHWSMGWLKGLVMVLMAGCLAWLPHLRGLPALYVYAFIMAFAMSVHVVIYFAIWGHMFGRRDLGQIQGVAHIGSVLAAAAGPRILAMSREYTGSYALSFQVLAAALTVVGIAFFFVRVPCADEPESKGVTP